MLREIEGWILPLLIPPLSKTLPALHKKTVEQAQPAEEPGYDDEVSDKWNTCITVGDK